MIYAIYCILQFPDYNKLFFLTTDASNNVLGLILEQKNEKSNLQSLTYASRSLNKAEQYYSTIKTELLTIVWLVKHRQYLLGKLFVIITDHQPLQWLMNVKSIIATDALTDTT